MRGNVEMFSPAEVSNEEKYSQDKGLPFKMQLCGNFIFAEGGEFLIIFHPGMFWMVNDYMCLRWKEIIL